MSFGLVILSIGCFFAVMISTAAGLEQADYLTGMWRPQDLMAVRDAAITDIIPKMTRLEGASDLNARMVYNLGHAVFEFIESRWGKEGIREYLFNLRKAVIGGGEEAYEESFEISADEFAALGPPR